MSKSLLCVLLVLCSSSWSESVFLCELEATINNVCAVKKSDFQSNPSSAADAVKCIIGKLPPRAQSPLNKVVACFGSSAELGKLYTDYCTTSDICLSAQKIQCLLKSPVLESLLAITSDKLTEAQKSCVPEAAPPKC